MKKNKIVKKTFFTAIGLCFLGVIILVSLLGENNKANDVALGFFKNLREYDYEGAKGYLASMAVLDPKANDENFEDYAFLFELMLLSHFNLLNQDTYHIEVMRESFWLPLSGENRIGINVVFRKKEESFMKRLIHEANVPPVKTLFTVERKKGIWKIVQINSQKALFPTEFERYSHKLLSNPGFELTQHGFIFDRMEFDPKSMTPVDRHIYQHFLRKATKLMSPSHLKEIQNG